MLQRRGLLDGRGECNRAVLVSVAEFDPGVRLGRRPGAERDAKRLHRTLSKLGFEVDIHADLGGDEIYELFLKGYAAFMHQLSGSVFLQTFCTLLEEEGNRNLELTRLMTRLAHSVAYTFQAKGRVLGGKKEMPCLLTRLTREVFPFAEPGKDGACT